MSDSYTCDCAIIGGGVSGTYAGWRLLTDTNSKLQGKKVAIFEMGERIGGRLMSWLPFGPGSGFRAELGGMRFLKEHQMVYNLVDQALKLDIVPFYTIEKGAIEDPALDHGWLYLRGDHTKYVATPTMDPKTDPVVQRYKLAESEKQFSSALLKSVITTIVRESQLPDRFFLQAASGDQPPWTTWDRKTWDEVKPDLSYQGRPLWKWGFWNLLSTILQSHEAYDYLMDALGYYSLVRNWNAAEALSFIALDFASQPDFFTLKEGYGSLPGTLAKKFTDEAKGEIFLHHQLVKFESDGQEGFILHFRETKEIDGVKGNEEFHQTVRAKQIILAIPQWALQKLEPSNVFNEQENIDLKEVIRSVLGQPAFKLFLLYEKRWWEEAGSGWDGGSIQHGHSICDLPIRQTYYFRPDICDQPNPPEVPYKDYGLLMVSYDDGQAVDYWRGMEEGPDRLKQNRAELHSKLQALLGHFGLASSFSGLNGNISGGNILSEWSLPPHFREAPQTMIDRAVEQVELLHKKAPGSTPAPLIGAYADWSLEPYGGGWNFWRPQFKALDIMKKMAEEGPLPGVHNVYIVGEAYCGLQGWVEGTLSQAEVTLQNHFGLSMPHWLPKDYYMGPGLRTRGMHIPVGQGREAATV